jgi:hypothetical protein
MERDLHAQRIYDFVQCLDGATLMRDGITWRFVMFDTFFQFDENMLSEEEKVQRIRLESTHGFHVRDQEGREMNIQTFLDQARFCFEAPGKYTMTAVYEPFTKALVFYCEYIPNPMFKPIENGEAQYFNFITI